MIAPPRYVFHSTAPVRASSAWKYPSRPPVNSTSPAVVRMPASVTSYIGNFHFAWPDFGSIAITAPLPTVFVHVLMGERAAAGPGITGASGTGFTVAPAPPL